MQARLFTIPVFDGDAFVDELNRFLAAHRILAVDRQFMQAGTSSAWAVWLSFEPAGEGRPPPARRGKVDYREVLNEQDFAVFARLRGLRKEMAEREGVPPYNLFTNEQLAELVLRRVGSAAAMREIPGVGEARTEKYGAAFLAALRDGLSAAPKPDDDET